MNKQLKEKPLGQIAVQSKGRMLLEALMNPLKFKPYFGTSLRNFSNEKAILSKGNLPSVSPYTFIDPSALVSLMGKRSDLLPANELIYISSIIASRRPKRLLEIGTCDGETTLHMALNAAKDALVQTVDLPPDPEGYLAFEKPQRLYIVTPVEAKIEQHLGNSMEMDFAQFAKQGPFDFIFIDADHRYEFVKNDTLKSLDILSEDGMIVWHDYTMDFPGVFKWLNELSEKLPLDRIKGTTLAIYEKNKARSQ